MMHVLIISSAACSFLSRICSLVCAIFFLLTWSNLPMLMASSREGAWPRECFLLTLTASAHSDWSSKKIDGTALLVSFTLSRLPPSCFLSLRVTFLSWDSVSKSDSLKWSEHTLEWMVGPGHTPRPEPVLGRLTATSHRLSIFGSLSGNLWNEILLPWQRCLVLSLPVQHWSTEHLRVMAAAGETHYTQGVLDGRVHVGQDQDEVVDGLLRRGQHDDSFCPWLGCFSVLQLRHKSVFFFVPLPCLSLVRKKEMKNTQPTFASSNEASKETEHLGVSAPQM